MFGKKQVFGLYRPLLNHESLALKYDQGQVLKNVHLEKVNGESALLDSLFVPESLTTVFDQSWIVLQDQRLNGVVGNLTDDQHFISEWYKMAQDMGRSSVFAVWSPLWAFPSLLMAGFTMALAPSQIQSIWTLVGLLATIYFLPYVREYYSGTIGEDAVVNYAKELTLFKASIKKPASKMGDAA